MKVDRPELVFTNSGRYQKASLEQLALNGQVQTTVELDQLDICCLEFHSFSLVNVGEFRRSDVITGSRICNLSRFTIDDCAAV